MANIIFCEIDDLLLEKIKEIANDRLVVDCGAGRGLFGSLYDGNVLSLDIKLPEEPLSPVIEKNCEHYCFPINSVPIFIRPCHSYFVHRTILDNIYKLDDFLYISNPDNLTRDLHLNYNFYNVIKISGWKGKDDEELFHITPKIKKLNRFVLPGSSIYFADHMLSVSIDSIDHEFKSIEKNLIDNGVFINGSRLRFLEGRYPMNEKYDNLFFDYGGMSVGNSMLEHICRYVVNDALKYPNRNYICVSTMTKWALEDALKNKDLIELPNIFLTVDQFANFIKNFQKQNVDKKN